MAIAPFNFSSYESLNILDRRNHEDPFYPRFWEERLTIPEPRLHRGYSSRVRAALAQKHRKGIFICDMSDLFGIGIPEVWTREVLNIVWSNPWHRFYLLTKQPQRLPKFSPFPDNAWVGVTATNNKAVLDAQFLAQIDAKVKYISFEPLLERIETSIIGSPSLPINWLIIGACTGSYQAMSDLCQRYPELDWRDGDRFKNYVALPKMEWLSEIVQAADKAGIRVFLKNNLAPLIHGDMISGQYALDTGLLTWDGELRQEMPK